MPAGSQRRCVHFRYQSASLASANTEQGIPPVPRRPQPVSWGPRPLNCCQSLRASETNSSRRQRSMMKSTSADPSGWSLSGLRGRNHPTRLRRHTVQSDPSCFIQQMSGNMNLKPVCYSALYIAFICSTATQQTLAQSHRFVGYVAYAPAKQPCAAPPMSWVSTVQAAMHC